MATYIVLANVTDKGILEAKDTIKRADKFKEMAKAAGVTTVGFDRAGYRYHGRVQAVAEGAREGGLEF